MSSSYQKLFRLIAYNFKDNALLEQALTHRSYSKNNNERLEFLGDSILGFVIAEALYQRYNKDEGKMSRYRSLLVRKETLAELAHEFKLGEYLRLGAGELKSGGYRRDSILADAVEALIGAILLDSDIEQAKNCILSWYQQRLENVQGQIIKDPKSQLQECLQAHQLGLPEYKVSKIEGLEHAQSFTVECYIEGLKIQTSAKGKSRRNAEQKCAQLALKKIPEKFKKNG